MQRKKKEKFSSEMQRRLCALADALGVSNREFSRKIGKCDNYVATMNNDITVGVVNNICSIYPNVNLIWLVTGEGEILKKEPITEELSNYLRNENEALKKENKELILEIGKLQGILEELKKIDAQQNIVVGCAAASM